MRHTIKYIERAVLYAATASQLLLIFSCHEDSLDWLIGTPISVVATTDGETRAGAAANIQTDSFQGGETINAYYNISGGNAIGKTPTTLTASAPADGKNVLTPDVQAYYPQNDKVDIMALYPPTRVNSDTRSFTVESDQTTEANYKLSDLIWAGVTGQEKTTGDVSLPFHHKMAKMAITVTGTEGVLIQEVRLVNTLRTIALPTLSATTVKADELGAVTAESDAEKKKILVAKTDETYTAETSGGSEQLTGAALFPPQPIAANFIEVVTNFGKTLFSVSKTFESGHEYTADLTITRERIGFTTTINDWTSNGHSIALPPGSNAVLKIDPIGDQKYNNGEELTPELTIWYTPNGGSPTKLAVGTDYDLEYFNNINIGTATVIITGKKSSAIETVRDLRALTSFEITSATGNIIYPGNNAKQTVPYVYNAIVDNPLETNHGDGTITFESTKPEVATVSERGRVTIRGVGTTFIKAHMAADGNYTESDAKYELEITPRDIRQAVQDEEITLTLPYDEITYANQDFKPQVVVTDGGRILQEGTHYKVTYSNNHNAGTASVQVSGTGKTGCNYSSATTATATFTIKPVTPTIKLVTDDITLPIDHSVVRLASTDYGTITYSGTSQASYVNGVVKGISATGTTPVTVTASVAADTQHGSNPNWVASSKTIKVSVVTSTWTFAHQKTPHTWECPLTGVYRLEAYGAQGGSCGGFNGGRGAYISGQLKVKKGQKLYVYVGEAGNTVTTKDGTQGGWNGGGQYTGTNTAADATGYSSHNYCGGGGATDFALKSATTWNHNDHLGSRILVAGGGGGALYYEFMMVMTRNADGSENTTSTAKFTGGGGGGGALVGETGYGGSKPGGGGQMNAGGTVTSDGTKATAGSFGTGGNYSGTLSAGMGGGGWFGGASGAYDASNDDRAHDKYSRQGSGGGGSSYIWNSTNATYYTGQGTNNAPSIPSGSKMTSASDFYITPTGETVGANAGDGKAMITYMAEDE